MTDRPIIFSAPMVRALIEGRKTQTRRVFKPQPGNAAKGCYHRPDGLWIWVSGPRPDNGVGLDGVGITDPFRLPYAPGDRLYVREAWRPHYLGDGVWDIDVSYPADGARRRIMDGEFGERDWNWPKAADRGNVTPLHMPRWASRLTLTVTDVRVQRLQDISEEDAIAEGWKSPEELGCNTWCPRGWFADLWRTLHGSDAWDANPWVVAVTFTVEQRNIDAGGA